MFVVLKLFMVEKILYNPDVTIMIGLVSEILQSLKSQEDI